MRRRRTSDLYVGIMAYRVVLDNPAESIRVVMVLEFPEAVAGQIIACETMKPLAAAPCKVRENQSDEPYRATVASSTAGPGSST